MAGALNNPFILSALFDKVSSMQDGTKMCIRDRHIPCGQGRLYIRRDDGTRLEASGILRKRDECVERAGGGAWG